MIGEEFQGKDQLLRDCRVVKNLSEHDYYLYDHEIELRKKRYEFLQASSLKNETELNFHKNWFKNYGKKFEHRAISKEILLAPAVWKTLEQLISK